MNNVIVKQHQEIGKKGNTNQLLTNYYGPFWKKKIIGITG